MQTEQNVFIDESAELRSQAEDLKEAICDVENDYDSYVSKQTQLFVAGLFLSFVMGLSAGCYIMAMLQAPCVGG